MLFRVNPRLPARPVVLRAAHREVQGKLPSASRFAPTGYRSLIAGQRLHC